VKSFLYSENLEVDCPDLGTLHVDVAYGGNFYAIVDPQKNFPGLEHFKADQLISWSRVCRKRLNERYQFIHPENEHIKGLSHMLWTGVTISPNATARNAVFYGDKAIDRSPCGTGTSARMAQWYSRGKLKKGDAFIHESIIGSQFTGRIEEETTIEGKPAIFPSIEGWAMVTGYNNIIIDDDDPYAHGFQVL
jgi:4-hydroxyproline epimerase